MPKKQKPSLDDLVQAYNQAEGEQEARLEQIFAILRGRQGNRRVEFRPGSRLSQHAAGHAWSSNVFTDGPLDLQLQMHVSPQMRFISKVEPGIEPGIEPGVAP